MAAKKKPTAKKAPAKKAAAKSASSKKPSKGKRYTDKEKSEVLAFVAAQGRGGQSAAAKKFGVSVLTISNWRKKSGGASKPNRPATKSSPKGAGTWEKMVALKADIDIMVKKLEAKKVELRKLATKL